MKITLSKHQRYACLGAAVIILGILWLQISDEGFRGYGWVLGILVAAVLAILGLGPVSAIPAPKPAATTPKSDAEIALAREKHQETGEILAIEIEERANALNTLFKDVAKHPGITLSEEDESPWKLEASLDAFVRERALLAAMCLVGLRRAQDNNLYVTSLEYKAAEKKIFEAIVRQSVAGMAASGLPIDKERILPNLIGELQDIRKCISRGVEARKRGDDPTDPLREWLGSQGLKISDPNLVSAALQTNSKH